MASEGTRGNLFALVVAAPAEVRSRVRLASLAGEQLRRHYGPWVRAWMAMLEFTQWAVDILRRSHEAARRFNPDATVRVFREGAGVRFTLTDRSEPGDRRVERDGFVLLVEEGIEGTIDVVEPHDQLILRETGSGPSS